MNKSKLFAFTCFLMLMATLTPGLQAQPLILANPTSTSAFPSTATSTFNIIATGGTAYQWQVSTNGTNFTSLTDTAPYSGSATATLTITGPSSLPTLPTGSSYSYRCLVTAGSGALLTQSNSTVAVLNVYPAPTETAVVTLSANTIAANDSTPITINITGLSAGEKVRINRYADINGNGSPDIGEPLVQSFVVTDGAVTKFGGTTGVTDPNIPGDDDSVASQITTHISLPTSPELARAVGTYLIKVISPSGSFVPITKTLTVTAPTYATGTSGTIAGTVTNGSTPIPYAAVALVDSNGNFFGATTASATGVYTLTAPYGSYQLVGVSLGYVGSMASAPSVTLNSTHTAVTGQSVAMVPATRTISANFQANTGTTPYPTLRGVQVSFEEKTANLIVVTSTDNDGNLVGAVTASTSWKPNLSPTSLGALGVLQGQNNNLLDTTAASLAAGTKLFNPANALIFGTLTDSSSTPVPLAGVGVGANDNINGYQSSTNTDATGHYYLLAWSPTTGTDTWSLNADNSNPIFSTTYVLPAPVNVITNYSQATYPYNLVAPAITAHLSGTATKGGVAQSGLTLDLFYMGANNNNTFVGSTTTASDGTFSFGVNAGTWQIDLDNQSANSANIVGPQLNYTVPAVSPTNITGIAYMVLPATGTISGLVTDATGAPLTNASVYGNTATQSNTVVYSAGAQTDGTGHYSFPVINGTWTVGANGNNGQSISQQSVPVTGSTATANLQATYISQQPQNQTVTAGQPASFGLQTSTPSSPTLQWQVSTDGGTTWNSVPTTAPYAGGTSGGLSINPTATSMNGYQYRCVVTYNSGTGVTSINSSVATLTVNAAAVAPTITTQPVSQTVATGQSATFYIKATGSPTPTYQWQLGGNPISGATSATYTISSAAPANAGNYTVVVTSGSASVTSAAATLTLTPAAGVAALDTTMTRPQFWRYSLPGRVTAGPSGVVYATFQNGNTVNAVNGQPFGAVIKLSANGTVDTSFNSGASLSDAWAVVPLTDGTGRILVGGVVSVENNDTGFTLYRVIRLNADGSRDTSYLSPVFTGTPRYMTLQPDGKLLVTPTFGSYTGNGGLSNLVRLNQDGSQDTTFAIPSFNSTNPLFTSIVVDANNKILIAGSFTTVNGTARPSVARLNSDGSLDSTFNPTGFTVSGQIRGLGVQTQGANSGKILVAGGTITVGTISRPVIRLNTDGTVDTSYTLLTNANVMGAAGVRPRLLNVLPDDRITIVSDKVTRLTATGALDTTYTPATLNTESFWIDTLADGTVLLAPEFGTTVNGTAVTAPVRLTSAGAIDSTFNPGKFQTAVYPTDISIQSDGRILVWGYFDTVGTTPRAGFARLNVNGTLDTLTLSGVTNLYSVGNAAVLNDGRILASTLLGTYQSNLTSALSRFSAAGALDTSFSLASGVNAAALHVLPNNSILTWNLTYNNLLSTNTALQGGLYFKRLTVDGALDTTFTGLGTTAFGKVYRNTTTNAITEIVLGQFSILGHYPDGRAIAVATTPNGAYAAGSTTLPITVLRLNADGTIDTTFNAPVLNWSTNAGFTTAILDPVTNTTSQWTLRTVNGAPYAGVVPQSDGGVIVYGAFTNLSGVAVPGIARLTNTGLLDTSFSVGTGPAVSSVPNRFPWVQNISIAPDGKIWVAGTFDSFSGSTVSGLVRLNANGTVDTTFSTGIVYSQYLDIGTKLGFGPSGEVVVAGCYGLPGEFPYGLNRLVSQVQPAIVTQPIGAAVTLGGTATLSVGVTPGLQAAYQWSRNGTPITGAINPTLTLTNLQSTDLTGYTVTLTTALGSVTSASATLALSVAPAITGQPQNQTVTAGQPATFSVTATGTPTPSYQWQYNGNNISGATNASYTISATVAANAGNYTVVVSNGVGSPVTSTAATLTVNPASVAPTITGQPQNQSVPAGQNATFTVVATGVPAPTYQWLKSSSLPGAGTAALIPGATNATLMIPGVASSDAGNYSVVVSNSTGTVNSNVASLTVIPVNPTITAIPLPTTVASGGKLSLSVQASGQGTLTYQWYNGATAITGATSATYTVASAQTADAGNYTVVITNANGSVTSSAVPVIVAPANATWVVDPNFIRPTLQQSVLPGRVTLSTDGKIYATWANSSVGPLTAANHQRIGAVIRLNANGSVDTTFGPGAALADAAAVLPQANGQLLVGGVNAADWNNYANSLTGYVVRLNSDGTRDTAYQSPVVFGAEPRFLTQQSDGKLLVVPGNTAIGANMGISTLARLNTDGTLDANFAIPTFDANGGFIFAPPVVDANGKILIVGNFISVNGIARPGIARLNADGTLDTAFTPSGFTYPSGQMRGVGIQTQGTNAGKILLAGGQIRIVGDTTNTNRAVIRLNANGSLDTTFTNPSQSSAGMSPRPRLLVMLPDASDKFYLAGATVKRFNADGTVDTAFASPTFTAGQETFWLQVLADNSVLIPIGTDNGYTAASTLNGTPFTGIAHLTASGTVDTSFALTTFQTDVYANSLAVQLNSHPVVIGPFNAVNSTARAAFGSLDGTGALDGTFNVTTMSNLMGAQGGFLRSDGKIVAEVSTGIFPSTATSSILLFKPDGTVDTSYTLDSTASAALQDNTSNGNNAEPLTGDGMIVSDLSPQQLINTNSPYLARLLPTGAIDTTFTPPTLTGYFGTVYRNAAAANAITQVALGVFNVLGHYADGRTLYAVSSGTIAQNATSITVKIARLNANGSVDTTFTSPTVTVPTYTSTYTLNDPTTSTTGGNFQVLQAQYNPFNHAIGLADGTVLVYGGGLSTLNGGPGNGLIRLTATGALDTSFSVGTGPMGFASPTNNNGASIHSVTVAPDGTYWVSGRFESFNGYTARGLVRLKADGTIDKSFGTDAVYRSYLGNQTEVHFAPDGSAYLFGTYAKAGANDLFPSAITHLINLAPAPVVTTQPVSQTVVFGQPVTFSVVASSTPAPTYQWYKGTAAITGATSATFTIASVQTSDVGSYTVQVTNAQGTTTSAAAVLTVNVAPVITVAPISIIATTGGSAMFGVTATGTPTPTYQWQKNGTAISGATLATLTLTNVQSSDAAVYSVVVTNSVTSVQSTFASLTVNPAPQAPGISTAPVGQTVSAGTPVAFAVGASGTAPLSYQWYKGTTAITGATNATFILASPQVADSGSYTVVVTNPVGSVTSAAAVLTVNALAVKPAITSQPVSQTVIAGNNAVFIVAATGTPAPTYQWQLGGTALTGATSAFLAIPNAQSVNAGNYTVVVTNSAGSVTSAAATLTVNAPVVAPAITTQPVGATVTAGTAVTFTVAASGTAPLSYQWQKNGSVIVGVTGTTLTLSSPQVADAGSYNVVVFNAAGFATSNTAALQVNPAGTPPAFTKAPLSQTVTAGANVTFTAAATGTAPLAYQWLKNGATLAGATSATLTLTGTQVADTGSYAVSVTNPVGTVTSSAATLTVNPAVAAPGITGATAVATLLNSPFNYQITATGTPTTYTATPLPAGLTVSATTGLISGTPTAAGTFTVVLGATNSGGTGTSALTLIVVAPAPVITSIAAASGRVGSAFGYTISATNSPTSFTATGLPAGLTLDPTGGVITGTPTTAGTFVVTLTASNGGGAGPSFLLTLGIAASVNVPVVTGSATATGTVGSTFVYVISASNTPTSFSATGLPAGLTVSTSTGLITGTPTAAGNFTMSVAATNAAGTSTSLAVLVTIAPAATAPAIISSSSATATVGAAFAYQIIASNTPTSFTATGLPAGLTLSATTGLISGTPTTAGLSAVLLGASNAGGTGSAALLLTVVPGLSAPVITSSPSVSGQVGVAFTYAILASNTPTVFTATTLPAGLAFNPNTGIISGTPSAASTATVTLTAGNAAGPGAPFALTMNIASAAQAPVITSDAASSGTQGQLFTYQIAASNGPITGYAATGLPTGLSLNSLTGLITGTPTAAATSVVILTASNAAGTSAPLGFLLTIQAGAQAPVVTSSLTAAATQGQLFTYLVTAAPMPSVSPLPPGNGFGAAGLPAGLALNPANGIIAGIPIVTGSFNVLLTATNDAGTSAVRTLVITVNPAPNAPVITSGNTAGATAGAAFSYQITATGLPTGYDAAGRPAWLSVNTATGALSGTPTAPGTYTASLTATNATGTSAAVTLTLTVSPAAGSPVITSTLTASGTATGTFSYQIGAAPGPITGYLVGTSLPSGLALDSTTGIISGTPTIPGTYNLPISAVNASGIGGAKTLVLTIAPAPGAPIIGGGTGGSATTLRITAIDGLRSAAATATLTASGIVNVPFAYQIVASLNPTAYIATGLPTGLVLNPGTGLISGLPATAGTFTAQIGATNSVGVGGTVPLVITISPPATAPAITSNLAASGTVGTAFTYQVTASNTPTSFNATGLPAGLVIDSTLGAVSGTPTAPGTYHVALSANNSAGTGTVSDFVVTIAAAASAPSVTSAATASGTVGAAFTYQVVASNTPTSYGALGLPPGVSLNTATGAITGTPTIDGQSSATLTATNAAGASTPFTLTITVAPSAATSVITSATSASVVAGGTLTYLLSATNSPVSYNISAVPAGLTANASSGLISGIPTVPGAYPVTLSANNLAGTGPAVVLTLTVTANNGTPTPTPNGSHIVNVSTRGQVGTGGNVLIAGFVITGTTSKPVIIRGVGPTLGLPAFGVTGTLPDPQLTLQLTKDGSVVAQNDNWATAGDPAIVSAGMARVGAFALPTGSLDSVIYITLAPGVYTATLSGNGAINTGIGIVEVYDNTVTLDSTSPRLVNISTRGVVGTGASVMIPGFVITGDQPKQVLIRCVGPTLANYGVTGTLADPVITLNDSHGTAINTNDNWGSAGDSAQIVSAALTTGAFALPVGSKDSAILTILQPGSYTVTVSGVNATTGVALVEVYELP